MFFTIDPWLSCKRGRDQAWTEREEVRVLGGNATGGRRYWYELQGTYLRAADHPATRRLRVSRFQSADPGVSSVSAGGNMTN